MLDAKHTTGTPFAPNLLASFQREVRNAERRVQEARKTLSEGALTERHDNLAPLVNAVVRAQSALDVNREILNALEAGITVEAMPSLLLSIATRAVGDNYSGAGLDQTRAYADTRRQEVTDASWTLGMNR
jgi:hypothetical protein